MTRLSGRVPETGTAISGVTVAIIDTQGTEDPTQWSIVASTTTDANGEWSVSGLAPSAVERYHAVAQYDSGTEFVNFESLPYLSTPADAFAPTTSVNVGTPTASVSVGSAIPDSVVDNFESFDADPGGVYSSGETLADYYQGDTGQFDRITTGVIEGNTAVQQNGSGNSVVSEFGDGLNRYPDKNETLVLLLRDNGGGTSVLPNVITNADYSGGTPSGYTFQHFFGNQELQLSRLDDGSTTGLATISTTGQKVWSWVEIDIPDSDGVIGFRTYNVDTATNPPTRGTSIDSGTATDTTYVDNRGVGFWTNSSSSSYDGPMLDWMHIA